MSDKKWVYLFNEVEQAEQYAGSWDNVRGLLGGKGANLAEMTRVGVPVPPGFTITTEACNAFQTNRQFPEGMWEQVLVALKDTERKAGKVFGDPTNPLLVSCRSGAKFSMPGMMDTVLNIGMNDETARGMIALTNNPRFVYDAYRRLIMMYSDVVMEKAEGIEPAEGQGIRQQLDRMLGEVKKAKNYKTDADIPAEDLKELEDLDLSELDVKEAKKA